MYDWANSVYNLVIVTAIFPIYYTSVTTDRVVFLGIEMENSVLYSYALSFSYLLSATILPLLSGIADYTGQKKKYLKLFTSLGSLACIGLFFFHSDTLEWGILCAVLASVGYSSGLVFYDAYLPEIAPPELTDRISARGYSFGYAGSSILLIVALALIMLYEPLGFESKSLPTRLVFVLVGLWWVGFAQIPFKRLPNNVFNRVPTGSILLNGYKELKKTFLTLRHQPNLKKYLGAFFFFNMGVQTVMLLATLFGTKELKLGSNELIPTMLIIQFVGIAGATLFARLSERKGNKFSLNAMITIWIGICLFAYTIHSVYEFYAIATLVGLVMGGIQALSRATFSKLLPEDTMDHASYFSFYDVTFHISVVLGTFSYGAINHLTGSMRNSTLALASYFIIGMILLAFTKIPRRNANPQPSGV